MRLQLSWDVGFSTCAEKIQDSDNKVDKHAKGYITVVAQNPSYACDNLSLQMMVSLDRTPYLWRQEEEEVTEITQ